MQQLSSLDTQFLAIENATTYGHVSGLAILDPSTRPSGTLALEDLKATIAERLYLLPLLRHQLHTVPFGLDRPYWVEDPRLRPRLPRSRAGAPGPGLRRPAGRAGRADLLPAAGPRPAAVGALPDRRAARGAGGVHDQDPPRPGRRHVRRGDHGHPLRPLARRPRAEIVPEPEAAAPPGPLNMLARGLVALPLTPVRVAKAVPTTLPHLDVAPSVLGLPGAERTSRMLSRMRGLVTSGGDGEVVERPKMQAPKVPFSRKISPHRRFALGSLELAKIKRVKRHYGVTVNDVVVAITAAATRDWRVAHDALPDAPLLAQIPVSVRTDEEAGTFGNKISVMIVPVPTDVADPEERLQAAHVALMAAKTRHRALPASALQDVAAFIPPAVNARAARVVLQLASSPALRQHYNMIISNVPGPPIPIYLAGAELVANYPVSVIHDGAGLNVTVLSYRDRVDFGIVADREQMPDLQDLIVSAGAALDELDARVG